jgi:hypothetical protein
VDAAYITPAIQKAQDMGLQPLIGSNLLDKVCTLVKDGTIEDAVNAAYKILLDEYITPYLCNKVMADIQIPLFAKLRNAGIVQSQDLQTQQLSYKDVDYIRKDFEYSADFYGTRMTNYLCANSTQYPEWRSRRNVADIPADPETFNTQIVL